MWHYICVNIYTLYTTMCEVFMEQAFSKSVNDVCKQWVRPLDTHIRRELKSVCADIVSLNAYCSWRVRRSSILMRKIDYFYAFISFNMGYKDEIFLYNILGYDAQDYSKRIQNYASWKVNLSLYSNFRSETVCMMLLLTTTSILMDSVLAKEL